ncbi:hypothetical protein KFE25_010686 [Diacronema lutheri]|uniref:CHK kinase-like domain-containing protein n=1 Tax=Diacronema lutheri TaxID=2081491 RepID=A0A8J5XDV4_DIALT|nr:hypothetical protein KFE25_010686 [Diacronema lutheri]
MAAPWWLVEPVCLAWDLLRALARILFDEALAAAGLHPPQLPPLSKAALGRCDARSRALLGALTGREVATMRSAPPDGIVGDAAAGTERLWLRVVWADEAAAAARARAAAPDPASVPPPSECALFVKLPSERLWLRAFLTFPGLYANEARFYASIAPAIPPSLLPRLHASTCQRSRFAIVLHDLKAAPAPARLYNLTEELPAAELEPVLLALAKLHAAFWDRPHAAWSEANRPPFYRAIMHAVLTAVRAKHATALPAHAEALFRRFVQRYDAVRAAWNEGPLCLVHGDCHLGNCFVRSGGDGGAPPSVGFYDWQVVSAEQPMRDVAYLLHLSADPAVLEAHERRLVGVYLAALGAALAAAPAPSAGAKRRARAPSEAEAWEAYRLHALYSLLAFVLTSGAGDFVLDSQVVASMSRRCVGACVRLDARGALEAAIARHDRRGADKAKA